nr:PAS domain-containing protein [uncultured Dongia sp.]
MSDSGFRLLGPADLTDLRCRAPKNRELLDYWLGKRGARRMPSRSDIDPTEIPDLLPHIMMTELTYEPFRARYRLVGTEIVTFAQFDFTNQYADALQFQDEDTFDYAGCYRQVADAGGPGIGLSHWRVKGNATRWIEFMICPLSQDDRVVTQCIATEDYEPLNLLERESLDPVAKR